ncbi:MAG TPA: cytochrome P450, partial [Usitatibacter sp.]|nr:cytochrome P450 [Usitatibacter sp.]
MLVPPRIVPPVRPLGRLAFIARFVRNPLEAIPQAVYEEDFIRLGGVNARTVWITSPSLVKAVLLDQRDKFRKLTQIRLLGPLLGKGILTSEGADWRWQRQASSPMFRPAELAGFVPMFVRAAEDTLARWRASPPGSVQAVDADMTRATFDVISSTLLPSVEPGFGAGVLRATHSLQRFGGWDILYASLNVPRWMPRPGGAAKFRAMQHLRSAVMSLVRTRRQAHAAGNAPDDLLERLILARDPETQAAMDDEQLVDNLLTFYLAGHETTAKALTWTLYLLARAPDWAVKLEDEIARVTGGAPLASEHIEHLVMVQQVLRESMRLYPPAPMMSRQAAEDTELEGHPITRGMSVLIPIYAMHRHVRRWKDPDAFDPSRFAPGREGEIPRYQYMPFGAGPRVCIGMSFALMEATAILATLLRGARFEATAAIDPVP